MSGCAHDWETRESGEMVCHRCPARIPAPVDHAPTEIAQAHLADAIAADRKGYRIRAWRYHGRANLEALADELEADALQVAGMLDQETKRGRIPNVAMVEAYIADAVAKRGAARKLRELLPAPRSSSLIGPAPPTTENEAGNG